MAKTSSIAEVQQITKSQNQAVTDFASIENDFNEQHKASHRITNALMLYITCEFVPLTTFESLYFKNLISTLNPTYLVPSRADFTERFLHDKFMELKVNLLFEMRFIQNICVAVDVWKSRSGNAYLGIVGHYMKDWSMHSIMLCCKKIKGGYSSLQLYQKYEDVVLGYDLESKVSCFVIDSISGSTKTFSFSDIAKPSGNFNKNEATQTVDPNPDIVSINPLVYNLLPKSSGLCFEHSLELVVQDSFSANERLCRLLFNFLKRVSTNHTSTSGAFKDDFTQTVQKRKSKRWYHELKMVRSFLNMSEETLAMFECDVSKNLLELNTLKDLLTVIEPLEEAADYCLRDRHPSISYVLPCIRGLRHHLTFIESNFNPTLIAALRESVEKHLSCYEQSDNYRIAAVLDARFKLNWCSNDNERDALRLELINELSQQTTPLVSMQTEQIMAYPEKKRTKLFSYMKPASSEYQVSSASLQVDAEVQSYLEQPCIAEDSNHLEFWKSHKHMYPNLCRLSEKYLAIPAATLITRNAYCLDEEFALDHCRLTDRDFEAAMFIKCNDKLFA